MTPDGTPDSRIESLRSVGNDSDVSIPTIALFRDRGFSSVMKQISSDLPPARESCSSLIITPPGIATFYKESNYTGRSVCFKPANGSETHYTMDSDTLGNDTWIRSIIRSIRFGCHSSNVRYSSADWKS